MTYYKSGNHVVEISCDEFAENPRDWGQCEEDWHIVCAEHRYYKLPNEPHETMSAKELSENSDYEVMPISFGNHGNIWLESGVHNDWDVRHCGYAWRKRSENYVQLDDVLDMWNQWANGEVMVATLYDLDGNRIDSIGGLYDNTEKEAVEYAMENFFNVPDFDVSSMEEVKPKYTMSFY